MKSTIILALASIAIAAPTRTIEDRQLPSFGSSSTTGSGLDAWKSLIPGLAGSSSGSDSSSSPESSSGSSLGIPGFNSGSPTENGVTENASCKDFTFIFARGTTEMGNIGSVAIQGVNYPADAAGNALMGASGGPAMAKLVEQALSQCPKTKILLGGYSQGAMVVHNAASSLAAGQVAAAVLFGDPLKAQSVGKLASDKIKEFCHIGDPVCLNGANAMAHITYGTDAEAAAQFLVEAAGMSTSS
ncbi:uncharacterized protein N7500_003172 [Penicillium coprophilum]|uniref:uncharacterized protein n=1 Tax=Penicillium coprophilum TaxID=36646 RepID=UPI00239CDCA1|nr:uncharacterized protein N7500_003172 [Penicillium coprophilum]KAJ5170389.1 hypothetical protein N7500_003172 [Penicillium coprophilum]